MNSIMQRFTFHKIIHKCILGIELPFYYLVKKWLEYNLSSSQGRMGLYMKTRGWFPFRRLAGAILEKKFIALTDIYAGEPYTAASGFMYDLKHRIAPHGVRKLMDQSNYNYTLARVIQEVATHPVELVVDYGCSHGLLTEKIRDSIAQEIGVVGVDLQRETLWYNQKMRPDIVWQSVESFKHQSAQHRRDMTVGVLNGVINFLTQDELDFLFGSYKPVSWVLFYHIQSLEGYGLQESSQLVLRQQPYYVDYNVPLLLKRYGYSVSYESKFNRESGGYFVSATAHYSDR